MITRKPETICARLVEDMKRLVTHYKAYCPSVHTMSVHRDDWHAIQQAGDIARARGFVIEGDGDACTITYQGLILRPTNLGKSHAQTRR